MKRIFWCLLLLCSAMSHAQVGLQNIIVEKYYISDAKDAKAKKGGALPKGSVTYRIYLDMWPGYRFQAAYGIPGHELRLATTTSFFNNEDAGAVTANNIKSGKLKDNTVMLDSWLSAGAGAEGYFTIPKSDDTSKAITNADGLLQNADTAAGIPIKTKDGLVPWANIPAVTFFGIDTLVNSIFNGKNEKRNGQVFSTENGSWACFGGSAGLPPLNRVLIAQITTDGVFSFELNLQLCPPGVKKVENYVARNAVNNEILFPGLIYSSAGSRVDK